MVAEAPLTQRGELHSTREFHRRQGVRSDSKLVFPCAATPFATRVYNSMLGALQNPRVGAQPLVYVSVTVTKVRATLGYG